MKVQQHRTEKEMINIACAMDKDPESWKYWSAIHMESVDCEEDDFKDVVISAKAIIESYLQNVQGIAYFCNDKDIYIICKNAPKEVLQQTAKQIDDLVFIKNFLSCKYRIYDLQETSDRFAKNVLKNLGEGFSFYITNEATNNNLTTAGNTKTSYSADSKKAKILLIEDDAVTRWMIQNTLEEKCDIISAHTANKAFSLYSAQKPDIVLLDIGLPDNNGGAVLEWIMNNDPGACVIMLSSQGNADSISRYVAKGAKGFISKPFISSDILHYIEKYA